MKTADGVYTISLPESAHLSVMDSAQLKDSRDLSSRDKWKEDNKPKDPANDRFVIDPETQQHRDAVPESGTSPRKMECCHRFPWKLLCDVLMGTSVSAGLIMIELGLVPSVQTGFYCDDPKISFKYNGDTITLQLLLSFTFIAPLVGLWIIEFSCHSIEDVDVCKSKKRQCLNGVKHALYWYWEFFVGLVMVLVVTDVAKSLVGEPRPHFLDTCRPDLATNCTSSSHYISGDYTCTNKDINQWLVRDSNKSFPSGHASMSTYTAFFMIMFIQRRVPNNVTFLLVPWLQCMCLVWAMLCSFTRISDHRHHWWDVLAGFFIGAVIAVFTVRTFCGGFLTHHPRTVTKANKLDGVLRENGHKATANGGNRHQSVRRLLSSTSSYTSSVTPEERELREVAMT